MKTSISATILHCRKCKLCHCVPPTILYAFLYNLCKLSKTTQQNKLGLTLNLFSNQ